MAAAGLSFTACNSTFDDLAINPNQQDVNSFYTTPANVDNGIKGIYSYITTPRAMGISASRILVNRSDEESDRTDYGVPGQYCASLTPSWYTLVQPFQLFYTAAAQACQMIESIPSAEFTDQTKKNAYLGEAYFLRAYCHWFLFINWRNIPLMDRFPQNSMDYKAQAAPADTWEFIIADLKKAKELLPKKGYWTGDDTGRVTSGTATALLGKAYLYRSGIEKIFGGSTTDYYNEAAQCFNEIIAGQHGAYKLVDNYDDNFKVATENNDESILEWQFLGDAVNTNFNPGLSNSGVWRDPRGVQPLSFASKNAHVVHQWVYDTFVASKDEDGYTDPRMFGTLIFDDTAAEIKARTGNQVIVFDGKTFRDYYTKAGSDRHDFGLILAGGENYKSACRKGIDWTLPTTRNWNLPTAGNCSHWHRPRP